jgi:hypothetical protein
MMVERKRKRLTEPNIATFSANSPEVAVHINTTKQNNINVISGT